MIFSIAVSLLEILPLPFYLKRGLTAVLEITNAISHFGSSHMSISRKVILLCMITSFGGLSAAVQTLSVYKKSRLSLWKYLLIRSLFSVSSGLLAFLVFICNEIFYRSCSCLWNADSGKLFFYLFRIRFNRCKI